MSNGNVVSEHPLKFATATVGVFSHDMKMTLLICNDRVGALIPPGGKYKPRDVNIYHTGLRELWEEVGIDLPVTDGEWLDEKGEIAEYQKIVSVQPFQIGTKKCSIISFCIDLIKNTAEKRSQQKKSENGTQKKTLSQKR